MTNAHEIEFTHFNEPINENTWQQIHESIMKINECISSHIHSTNLGELSGIINSLNTYDDFIINCLSSDRTRLSGVTVDLLITMCNMFNKFRTTNDLNLISTIQSFDRYLKTTLLVCNKVNKVLQTRGEQLLLTLAENDILFFRNNRAIVETTNSKSKIQRLSLFKALSVFVKKENDRVGYFGKLHKVLLDIMKSGIKDVAPEIRNLAREFVTDNNSPKIEHKSIKEIIRETKKGGINLNAGQPHNSNITLPAQRLYQRPNISNQHESEKGENTIKAREVTEIKVKKMGKESLNSSTDMIYQNLAESAELYKNSPMKKITRLKNNHNKTEDEIFTPKSLKTFLSKYRPETKEENFNNPKKNIQKLSDEINKLMVEKNIQKKLITRGVDIGELKKNLYYEGEGTENILDLEDHEVDNNEIDEYNNLKTELQEIEAYKIKEFQDLENSFYMNENIVQNDTNDQNHDADVNENMDFVIEQIESKTLIENTLSHESIHETTPINENNRSPANAVYLNNSQQSQNKIFEPEIIESSSNGESELDKLVSLADEEKLKSDFEDEEIREQNLILEDYDKENILENEEKINQQDGEVFSMNIFNILSTELQNKETTDLLNTEEDEVKASNIKGPQKEVYENKQTTKEAQEKDDLRIPVKTTNKRKTKNRFGKKRKSKKTSTESPRVHEISLILSKEQEIENSQTEIKEKNNLLENRDEDTVNDLDKSLLELSVEVVKDNGEDK